MYQRCGFFSYKRGTGEGAEIWYERTAKFISETIQPQTGLEHCPMFYDKGSIPNGAYWENELRDGLDKSPFLIAFFSPSYFNSTYCMAELRTFIEREDQLGLPRGSLIQTATISEITEFPDWAQDIQTRSFQEFFVPLPSYWDSTAAAKYAVQLSEFSMQIAQKINTIKRGGPQYDEGFPKLSPQPVDVDPGVVNMFAPVSKIKHPFARGIAA